MAPSKKATKKTAKKKAKSNKPKCKGLFDHFNAVTSVQDPNYFDKLTDDDKKTWSSYMIMRMLSYEEAYLEAINELQKYSGKHRYEGLSPEMLYKLLIGFLPKQRIFNKFLKGKNEDKYPKVLVDLITNHFEISRLEAISYIDIYNLSADGKDDMMEICKMYGHTEKEIKKWK